MSRSSKKIRYNTSKNDPVEAIVALAVGQSLTPRGQLLVKHYSEEKFGFIPAVKIKAKDAEDLRKKMYAMVDSYIGSYIDFINGV